MLTLARIRMPENGVLHCQVTPGITLLPGERCIAEFDYGLDNGTVLELYGAREAVSDNEKIPAYRIVRKMTADDEAQLAENAEVAQKAGKAFALSTAREKGNVKILQVRFSYGRERLFIRYSAQVTVDLRRFVSQVQRDFKTRVDLWQVGVRDEAALIGCLGPCGRAVCCCSWQSQFRPVNVRMAREQEMSLNPVSINGSCGRLKCCLRFEHDQYREAGEQLPETGSIVRCRDHDDADGRVAGRDIMRGRLTVRTRDGRFLTVDAATVTVLKPATRRMEEDDAADEDSSGEWT